MTSPFEDVLSDLTRTQLVECLAAVIERRGTDDARQLADEVRAKPDGQTLFVNASERLGVRPDDLIADFCVEVQARYGHRIGPVGRPH